MEREGSLSHSQEHATCPYPEQVYFTREPEHTWTVTTECETTFNIKSDS
jgi:hypothetical protein